MESDFQERYKGYSDEAIREILVRRKDYQEAAVKAAVAEAISRGIIHSEQDLFAEEFNPPARKIFQLFPSISKTEQKEKILASIYRLFFLAGIVPLIFGGINFYKHALVPGIVFLAAGAVALFFNFRLSRTKNLFYLNGLLLIVLAAFGYTLYSIVNLNTRETMDFIVAVSAFLMLIYCLLFARSIIKH